MLILQCVYADMRSAVRNRIASVAGDGPAWLLEPLLSYQSRLRIGVWTDAMSPRARLALFRGPVLVIGGAGDHYVLPAETRSLYQAAVGPKRLWWIAQGGHAAAAGYDDPAYRAAILAFLRASLPVRPAG